MFIFSLSYMCFHMKSIFLALISLSNIMMSIPITMVVYHYVMKITYFSNPHLSIIIVIIGIGADDIIVFHDIWEGVYNETKNQKTRLNYIYHRAQKQMLITSLTSTIAFLSCINSRVMPIQSFGIFAAMVVPLCYLITITF